jgi:hypothetical protein
MGNTTDRRRFLQLMGVTALATLKANIAKAVSIPANDRTGTIKDVEHIVILMQENRPFDHHFGTLRGVRGFSDPRAVRINLPLQSGTGSTPVPVFLQPAGATNVMNGFAVPPNFGTLGGPSNGADVVPPFRVNPDSARPGLTSLAHLASTTRTSSLGRFPRRRLSRRMSETEQTTTSPATSPPRRGPDRFSSSRRPPAGRQYGTSNLVSSWEIA